MKLLNGDCLEKLKEIKDNSVDAVITDPPYGLGFMGKEWDTFDKVQFGIKGNEGENDLKVKKNFNILPRYNSDGLYDFTKNWAEECLRVLKPGGYLLSFAGTRTQHKIASGIEDAGFEIRDMIAWVYGSGFPKSLNIGKAVDKLQGNEREVVGNRDWNDPMNKPYTNKHYGGERCRDDIPMKITKGTSEWEGWGTALKPALEPITVARKPIEGTVAENCLKWGVGGINIDECRVVSDGDHKRPFVERKTKDSGEWEEKSGICKPFQPTNAEGRFPANLIHDGSDEVVELFPNSKSTGGRIGNKGSALNMMGQNYEAGDPGYGDSGSAARFFKQCNFTQEDFTGQRFLYQAKASKSERNMGCEGLEEKTAGECTDRKDGSAGLNSPRAGAGRTSGAKNNHPTVKPIALMEYLIKLVSREGHAILDPFMGSGTTGIACKNLKRHFIGIERDEEYLKIAKARIKGTPERLL